MYYIIIIHILINNFMYLVNTDLSPFIFKIIFKEYLQFLFLSFSQCLSLSSAELRFPETRTYALKHQLSMHYRINFPAAYSLFLITYIVRYILNP